MKRYQIQCRENRDLISTCLTLVGAERLMKAFYSEDSFNNEFVADLYTIVEIEYEEWYEVFKTDADGTTETIMSFDQFVDAWEFIDNNSHLDLKMDKWERINNGIPTYKAI